MRLMLVATIAVATFGFTPPAHAKTSSVAVTADQCRKGGGFVYGGKCHEGTWNGQTVRG
jgi:hypothetical protein